MIEEKGELYKGGVKMEKELKVALITAIAVLMGALLGMLGGVITSRVEFKNRLKQESLNTEKQIYIEFVNQLQLFANNPNGNFEQFQLAVMKLCVLGDKHVAENAKSYYNAMIESTQTRVLIDQETHYMYQENILNSMRKRLLGNNQNLENLYFVPFTHEK